MRDPGVGDTLDGYELQVQLARGGMATIFRAVDRESGRTVALKIPHIQYEADVVFYERFRREEEARAAPRPPERREGARARSARASQHFTPRPSSTVT